MTGLFRFILSLIISYTICSIFYYFINKKLIKDNIDLFIKKHESQVIHEVNNELFKDDIEELKNEKKGN